MSNPVSVLIVEDEEVLREVYELILTTQGCTVQTAKNGIEALDSLRKHTPDIMLLDIFMPEMDGREVLKKLDKADFQATKVVVCSNLSDKTVIDEVLRNGAVKFVLKSDLGPKELIGLIDEVTHL